jgi:hypothetical protein
MSAATAQAGTSSEFRLSRRAATAVLLSMMLAFKRYSAYTISKQSRPGHNATEEASLRVSDILIGRIRFLIFLEVKNVRQPYFLILLLT